jgi:hypothetical protein
MYFWARGEKWTFVPSVLKPCEYVCMYGSRPQDWFGAAETRCRNKVCMYVCMCVCMHVCMYACKCARWLVQPQIRLPSLKWSCRSTCHVFHVCMYLDPPTSSCARMDCVVLKMRVCVCASCLRLCLLMYVCTCEVSSDASYHPNWNLWL